MKKYYASCYAAKGYWLLGGVKIHRSSSFPSRTEAIKWIESVRKANRIAGRKIWLSTVNCVTIGKLETFRGYSV
jgi:hypothetical protein